MLDFLKEIQKVKKLVQKVDDIDVLELLKKKILGKCGFFNQQIKMAYGLPLTIRFKKFSIINKYKQDIEKLFIERKNILQLSITNEQVIKEKIDISLPGRKAKIGRLHPITSTINRIVLFFKNMGFSVIYGPEIEDNYHNFDLLNIPDHHPARNCQDTFWIDKTYLLRTQTSGTQIRIMNINSPPIRMISPGRVYRRDYDKYHTPMFHQIEGLVIDKSVNFSNLKGMVYDFLYYFFNDNSIKIRFRASYFPFTEPSAEIDIMYDNYNWLEILGCGMVHPNVLLNVNVNPEIFSGFAFGLGIERLAMLYYGVTDLRLFFENDIRFLTQFK